MRSIWPAGITPDHAARRRPRRRRPSSGCDGGQRAARLRSLVAAQQEVVGVLVGPLPLGARRASGSSGAGARRAQAVTRTVDARVRGPVVERMGHVGDHHDDVEVGAQLDVGAGPRCAVEVGARRRPPTTADLNRLMPVGRSRLAGRAWRRRR